ncbi:Type 1 glutamine amidotransferase-like domain-containing protein [Alkalihalobacillus sp. 1P02AB]|uniref:Type 1 glutamine amidotransferase-like domain-containing protein n=1 Tax=Alkalihalobacillus sp. 1P02AB TaxID=3132260 RepID=UPI0039A72F35
MGKVVAIGGGEVSSRETFLIDKFIVEFANKQNPDLIFIPTASNDNENYSNAIKELYGKKLNCNVDVLNLIKENFSFDVLKRKLLSADIIYVGGGDTIKMLKVWEEKKVNKILIEAYRKNKVMAGLSAGAICWFKEGHSERDDAVNARGYWDKETPIGLGLIPAIHCPHYNEAGSESFDKQMNQQLLPGIAIDNNCAFVQKDNKYKIIKAESASKAYLFQSSNGIVKKTELTSTEFMPINHLF